MVLSPRITARTMALHPAVAFGAVIAEFKGDRIRSFRQYWHEADLLEGFGLLPV